MRKYLLSPSPLIASLIVFALVQWRGQVLIDRGTMHPYIVNYYSDFFVLVGLMMSLTWLAGCVVHDAFRWIDRRPLRKALKQARNGHSKSE